MIVRFHKYNLRKADGPKGPGVHFTDAEFPVQLIELLKLHPRIDQFEAEYAIYVTDSKRLNTQSQHYDIKEILGFCLAK